MNISNKYITVERIEKEKTEGFQAVEVQDSFVCKGRISNVPEAPVFMGNKQLAVSDVVLWAKGSPDTHEAEGQKFIAISDLLAVL